MYFLRRRHGRKPQSEARRDPPPTPVEPAYEYRDPETEAAEPPKPVVITKPKRQRVVPEGEPDCKPAGTFRAGTLHLAKGDRGHPSHGKA